MSFNLNYVPWMTLLGVLGAGIGYLVGGSTGSQNVVSPIYGLCFGSMAGILVRILVRSGKLGHKKQVDREK